MQSSQQRPKKKTMAAGISVIHNLPVITSSVRGLPGWKPLPPDHEQMNVRTSLRNRGGISLLFLICLGLMQYSLKKSHDLIKTFCFHD